jgi:transposase
VQQSFGRDPFAGELYIFRVRRGDLCKIIWHNDGGMSLYAKRLERGKYSWPSAVDGVIAISPSQMACMLEAIDWRNPQATCHATRALWPQLSGDAVVREVRRASTAQPAA